MLVFRSYSSRNMDFIVIAEETMIIGQYPIGGIQTTGDFNVPLIDIAQRNLGRHRMASIIHNSNHTFAGTQRGERFARDSEGAAMVSDDPGETGHSRCQLNPRGVE